MRDEVILRKIRAGDPSGLEALMDRYIGYVSTVCWNILRGSMAKEDVEEVASDVFLAAWNQAEDVEAPKLKAWLGAVARNMAKSKLREMGRELPLEEDILEIPDENTPVTTAERKEEQRLIRRSIDRLGEPEREIFLRHYYYCQTVREISQVMHLNESTVKTKLRRGRSRLRAILLRWGVT